jgi:asparagine synthetase B (glutamine-hydrolysing)
MIFDFYLSVDFNPGSLNKIEQIKFKNEPFYKDIRGTEESTILKNGYSTCLYRRSFSESFIQKENLRLWIFGDVFTTKKYAESKYRSPWKLNASEVIDLYLINNNVFVNNLKGSFVLVFFDELNNTVTLLTDRLNVLPLYYAYEKGKLIISSNTELILKTLWVNREPDTLAFAMQNLFDYMLGDLYFFKGIRRFENASIYTIDGHEIERTTYWDVSELFHKTLLPPNESLDILDEQLKDNVNLYSSDADKLLVSLTGGFDGRANLAMLERPYNSFKCYSYGMPGSKQIIVPQEISDKTGINYEPVILEQEFLDQYYGNTLKASYFSNGTAPVGFCNIPYAYHRLANYSDTILTGLFGSEVLRPLHNNGIQVNDQSFSIFLNDYLPNGIEEAIQNVEAIRYFKDFDIRNSKEALLKYFSDHFFEKYSDYDKIIRFFFFIIQEGIRKYFSQEISLERVYVTTRFPYFDTDMVDLIYRTPWAGMYNGFLGESKFKRRKGQLLYAHIIKKYKPSLGKIILDRGYTPDDLLLPFPINYLKIGTGVWRAKRYLRKADGNDTFKTEIWADSTLKRICSLENRLSETVFNGNLSKLHDSKKKESSYLTFRHMSSIQSFFFLLNQK